jgi:hypothetical protein
MEPEEKVTSESVYGYASPVPFETEAFKYGIDGLRVAKPGVPSIRVLSFLDSTRPEPHFGIEGLIRSDYRGLKSSHPTTFQELGSTHKIERGS